jgi:hypothetical protein
MATTNTNRVSDTSTTGPDLSSISSVIDTINTAFDTVSTPVNSLPPVLVLTGSKIRPGIEASTIASRVIARQSEMGLPVGNCFSSGPNTTEAMITVIVQEIVSSLLLESKLEITIDIGSIGITSSGANAGGPVLSYGNNLNLVSATGVLR